MADELVKLETLSSAERAGVIRKEIKGNEGKAPLGKKSTTKSGYNKEQLRAALAKDIPAVVRQLDALRTLDENSGHVAVDISMGEYVRDKFGFAMDEKGNPDSYLECLGVQSNRNTLHSLYSMKDFDQEFRWLIPEVIRDAIRLGLRRNPVWPNLVASEQPVSQTTVTMPHINMSAANPRYTNEGETIQTGDVSFGQRKVNIRKITTGMKITDEIIQYVALNILSVYLQDVGVKLDNKLSTLAIDTLINGDMSTTNMSAPVIGVRNPTDQLQRFDLLRAWTRMGRLGRQPQHLLSGENMFLHIMELPEFKGFSGETTKENMIMRTPLPTTQNMWIHGAMVDPDLLMLIDQNSALIKLNAQPLRIENERIVQRQMQGSYVSVTTGFANLFRDGRILIDQGLDFATNGFPSYMDVDAEDNDPLSY